MNSHLAATEIAFDWAKLLDTLPALVVVVVVLFVIFCTILLPVFVFEIYRNTRRSRIAAEKMVALLRR